MRVRCLITKASAQSPLLIVQRRNYIPGAATLAQGTSWVWALAPPFPWCVTLGPAVLGSQLPTPPSSSSSWNFRVAEVKSLAWAWWSLSDGNDHHHLRVVLGHQFCIHLLTSLHPKSFSISKHLMSCPKGPMSITGMACVPPGGYFLWASSLVSAAWYVRKVKVLMGTRCILQLRKLRFREVREFAQGLGQ